MVMAGALQANRKTSAGQDRSWGVASPNTACVTGSLIVPCCQLPAGVDELRLRFSKFKPVKRGPRHQQEIAARGHKILMAAEDLAQSPLGRIASDGRAHRSSRGNHGNPHDGRRRLPGILSPPPPQRECTAVNAAACDVLRAPTSVVPRLAMAVVESPAICLGLSEEIGKDICQSEPTLCHASLETDVSRSANLGSTHTPGHSHSEVNCP